jgi:hypothetical protein
MPIKHGVDTLLTRVMLEAALMLSEMGRYDDAMEIIRGVREFRDDVPHPSVCLGVVYLFKGEPDMAAAQLEATLRDYPDHPLTTAMLGTALRESYSPRWRDVLQSVIDSGTKDAWALDLATTVLAMPDMSLQTRSYRDLVSAPLV